MNPHKQEFQQMNDYSKSIHNKANETARDLLVILAEKKDLFVPMVPESAEEQDKVEADTLDFGNDIVNFLATRDIPKTHLTFSIDKLIDNLTGLKRFVDGTARMYEDEYLSRSLGVKNKDGKYRHEELTLAQLILKLDEVRQATGNKREDFYNDTAPEMPAPTESPYVG